LDRDGVINVNHGYVHTPARTEWVHGIFEFVSKANQNGYLPIVVTNQAGIGRGYYSEFEFLEYTKWMHKVFEESGAPLAATFWCPHHPLQAQGSYRVECVCRKPQPGMLLDAMARWQIESANSLLIGDNQSDIDAAHSAQIARTILYRVGQNDKSNPLPMDALDD
jgi:D-glycero-D-manno-heptose 1,7-bisphosphate phosphatase